MGHPVRVEHDLAGEGQVPADLAGLRRGQGQADAPTLLGGQLDVLFAFVTVIAGFVVVAVVGIVVFLMTVVVVMPSCSSAS